MPRRRKVAFPCIFCEKRCMSDTIECSACNSCAHRMCASLTAEEYAQFASDGMLFLCPHCMGKQPDGYNWSVLLCRLEQSLTELTATSLRRLLTLYQAHPLHVQTPMPGSEDVTSRDILRLLQPRVLQTHSPQATMVTYEITSCLYLRFV